MSTQPVVPDVPVIAKSKLGDLPLLWTMAEAAAFLRVSRATIKRWCRDGLISVVRYGPRCVRIPRSEIERLLRAKFVARPANQ